MGGRHRLLCLDGNYLRRQPDRHEHVREEGLLGRAEGSGSRNGHGMEGTWARGTIAGFRLLGKGLLRSCSPHARMQLPREGVKGG